MNHLENMLSIVSANYSGIKAIEIEPSELIFEERVKLNCFYCGKFNNNWRCPPKIPQYINFSKVINEYKNGAFVFIEIPFSNETFQEVRTQSSNIIHRTLLKMEQYLWEHNNSTAVSFIGGSCKLCKGGCGKDSCNNPYHSRSPIESIGVNVVDSAKKYGLCISFPPNNSIMRVGLLLW